MKIPIEFYEVLRNRINISDVIRQKIALIRKSGEYIGICPFHQEKTPSFTVNDSKKFYYCFGCSAHGDVIKFISVTEHLSYKDSAIKLANNYGIEIPKLTKEQENIYEEYEGIYNILSLAAEFFQSSLNKSSVEYLESRGIGDKLINEFQIGYAPSGGKLLKFFENKSTPLMKVAAAGLIGKGEQDNIYEIFHNRIIFPIKNVYNKIVGFGGRALGDHLPKYLNSPETLVFKKSEVLYGENNAISAARKKNHVILVEGYIDVITLHNSGFTETVASLGTAVNEKHLQKLWNTCDEIILCMDGDSAGIRASQKVINTVLPLITHTKKVSFLKLPKGLDPDNVIKQYGAGFFKQLLENKINLSQMIWELGYEGKNFSTAEQISGLEIQLQECCNKINDQILKKNYKQFFKDQVWQKITSNKRGKQNSLRINSEILISDDYSEIEILEQALCMVIIKFPEILKIEEIKSQLLSCNFKNKHFSHFIDLISERFSLIDDITNDNIEGLVKKTGLLDAFVILSKFDNLFYNTLSVTRMTPREIWELLHKKYYLSILKKEYTSIIQDISEKSFKQVVIYRQEILKISKELQILSESFIKT